TGGFFQAFARHITILNRRHFNVEIDPIEQRAGDPLPITLDLARTTTAFAFQVAEITARTRIHRRHQHELAWESDAASCSRNGDASILQWLAHHLQSRAMKFRELVEKENAIVREADFTGVRNGAAAEQSDIANGMMRRTERTRRHE